MTPPIRMVSVPEPTIAACEGEQEHFETWAKLRRYDMSEHPLHYIFTDPKTDAARMGWNAALAYVREAAAPVREEGGAVSNDDTPTYKRLAQALSRHPEIMVVERSDPTLELTARSLEEVLDEVLPIATREEAPAEAGELAEAVERLTSAADFLEGDCVIVGDHEVRGDDLLAVLSTLLAQPQAREEAQPVAWLYETPSGLKTASVEPVTHIDGVAVTGSPLYTTPPAPEAEKLRAVTPELAAEFANIDGPWTRGQMEMEEVWSRLIDAQLEALAALQQEGR